MPINPRSLPAGTRSLVTPTNPPAKGHGLYWHTSDRDTIRLYWGDVLQQLRAMPSRSVHCCVTSPPYFGLRDYGTGEWEGGRGDCDHVERSAEQAHRSSTLGTSAAQRVMGTGREHTASNAAFRATARQFVEQCKKCGARRTDQQIGSEKTPEEFVAKMVTVFREVRRVLRMDGCLFLNLGDTYSGDLRKTGIRGIDAAWLAALIDGEGCIQIHRQKRASSADSFQLDVSVGMMDPEMCKHAHEITGVGSVTLQNRGVWDWSVRGQQASDLLRTIYPWLLIKKRQAAIGVELCRHVEMCGYNRSNPVTQQAIDYRSRLKESCASCNQRVDNGMEVPPLKVIPTKECDLAPGNLLGIPWRVALALQADGWILRSDIPWVKRNAMPESVDNRPAKSLEYVFLLTQTMDYYFDMEAIKPASIDPESLNGRRKRCPDKLVASDDKGYDGHRTRARDRAGETYPSRNFRNADLWFESVDSPHGLCGVGDELVGLDVTSESYSGSHYATFPQRLITPLILASTSARGCCGACGKSWRRILSEATGGAIGASWHTHDADEVKGNAKVVSSNGYVAGTTVGWETACGCSAPVVPCTVLDPFMGSGTTAAVCLRHRRRCWGIELSEEYLVSHAIPRIEQTLAALPSGEKMLEGLEEVDRRKFGKVVQVSSGKGLVVKNAKNAKKASLGG